MQQCQQHPLKESQRHSIMKEHDCTAENQEVNDCCTCTGIGNYATMSAASFEGKSKALHHEGA